jgi:hypothetical protein
VNHNTSSRINIACLISVPILTLPPGNAQDVPLATDLIPMDCVSLITAAPLMELSARNAAPVMITFRACAGQDALKTILKASVLHAEPVSSLM